MPCITPGYYRIYLNDVQHVLKFPFCYILIFSATTLRKNKCILWINNFTCLCFTRLCLQETKIIKWWLLVTNETKKHAIVYYKRNKNPNPEEYPEETDYKNDWKIKEEIKRKVNKKLKKKLMRKTS